MIAFERVPEESEAVDYFLDSGQEVPKRPPEPAELFARAMAQKLGSITTTTTTTTDAAATASSERWMRVLTSVDTATKQLQDVVTTLSRCESGTFTLSHISRQAPSSSSSSSTSSTVMMMMMQKRDALRSAAEALREAASRARAAAATRAEYLSQAAALAQRWRLVAPSDQPLLQVDCAFLQTPRRLETLDSDPSGRPSLALSSGELCLCCSDSSTNTSSLSSSPTSVMTSATSTVAGAEACHAALSALERTSCAQAVLKSIAAEAVRVRQGVQTSLHAVVEGDGSVVVCCSGSVLPHDSESGHKALRISLAELPRESLAAEIPRLTATSALVAAAECLAIDQWRWDSLKTVRDGAITWSATSLPPISSIAVPKPQRPSKPQQSQQQQATRLQQQSDIASATEPARGRGMLETLAVLHAHRLTVFETARILDQLADSPLLRGTVTVHWGVTTRSPAVVTPFTIASQHKTLHGSVEGPYVRIGSTPVGSSLIPAFVQSLLHVVC